MEVATEEILKDVAHVTNAVDKRGRIIKRATNYLKAREVNGVNEELKHIENQLSPGNFARQAMSAEGLKHLAERRTFLQDKLENHAAPELGGEAKDALAKRLEYLDAKIRVGMPRHEDMRRNPAGAVDQHRRWDRLNKCSVLERRNIKIALEPGNDDKDGTNIDMIRPHAPNVGAATFAVDAQIPGHFAMTPAAKANWPEGMPEFGTLNNPLKQAEKVEALAAKPGKREWTDEQKAAARERGLKLAASAKAAREAKALSKQAE